MKTYSQATPGLCRQERGSERGADSIVGCAVEGWGQQSDDGPYTHTHVYVHVSGSSDADDARVL